LPELETLTTIAFAPLVKYNVANGEFAAVAASERVDRAGESFDYEKSKPYFKEWSETFRKRTQGKSLGNVREMHKAEAVGVLKAITFDDKNKQILIRGRIVDPVTKRKCEEGVLTGVSIGGSYVGDPVPDAKDPRVLRYVARPTEISVVDDPANEDATFELIGADGATKMMKFAPPVAETIEAEAEEAAFRASLLATTVLRKSNPRFSMTTKDVSQDEQLAKALKKLAKARAQKIVRKAFGIADGTKIKVGVKAYVDGLIKAAVADRPTKDEVTKANESIVNGLIEAIRSGPLPDKKVEKAAESESPIRLVADDEGKTGENQSDEAKALRKSIEDAKGKLEKLNQGGGERGADNGRRYAAAL